MTGLTNIDPVTTPAPAGPAAPGAPLLVELIPQLVAYGDREPHPLAGLPAYLEWLAGLADLFARVAGAAPDLATDLHACEASVRREITALSAPGPHIPGARAGGWS